MNGFLAIQKLRSVFYNSFFQSLIAATAAFIVIGLFLAKQNCQFLSPDKSTNAFVYLASSFLHGRLDLDPTFPNHRDLSIFHGKIYAMWPPLSAFLLMPLVQWRGLYIGDYWVNAVLVAISAMTAWLMMDVIADREGWTLSGWYKCFITIFLICGTAFLILSMEGAHWYMAQVAAATMMLIAIFFLFAKNKKPQQYLLAGTFWALGILSRLHLILAAPVFFYVALFGMTTSPKIKELRQNWQKKIPNILWLAAPVVLVVLFNAWYNFARFGSIFETGFSYHQMWDKFAKNFKHFGYIHPHYFLYNAYYTLLRIPLFEHQHLFKEPSNANWVEGYSIFFQSPVLIYALASLKLIKKDGLVTALWLSIIPVSIPILCLMGTGCMQFGARYLFDLFPLLFPLTIIGSGGRITPLLVLLVVASIVINAWGLHLFGII